MVPALRSARTGLSKVNSYGVFVSPPPTPKESNVRNLERSWGPTRLRHTHASTHRHRLRRSRTYVTSNAVGGPRLRHTHTHASTDRHRLRRGRTYITSHAVRGPRVRGLRTQLSTQNHLMSSSISASFHKR